MTERTFGIRVGQDRECRRLAVELDLAEADLRLFGRFVHFSGYRSLEAAREWLRRARASAVSPFSIVAPCRGTVVDLTAWRKQHEPFHDW